ncbi:MULTISPECIES: HesB/IscA family protein [Xanthobacter]|uniref:HesB/IscA family protein n=1 Tax=Xanthobacter TaxID=279 RepID=UPI001F1EEEE1|nr:MULTISPECIES: iron-sulfur cluster assembly accessory protein [unclassified Xanthobacter]
MISLSTSAVEAVKVALSLAARSAEGLRLVAGEGAPHTLQLMMHLDVARKNDVVIEQGGVKLFLDDRSRAFADGLHIDFVTARGVDGGGFVVEPHAARHGRLG